MIVVQSELLRIGTEIAIYEQTKINGVGFQYMDLSWRDTETFSPGLEVKMIAYHGGTLVPRRLRAAIFNVIDVSLGDASLRVDGDPRYATVYENDFADYFLGHFGQYDRRDRLLTPAGLAGTLAAQGVELSIASDGPRL